MEVLVIGESSDVKNVDMNTKSFLGSMAYNVERLCVVALSKNLKLTTTLDRVITQNPCYVPLNFQKND